MKVSACSITARRYGENVAAATEDEIFPRAIAGIPVPPWQWRAGIFFTAMKHNHLQKEAFLDALDYDPKTGIFRWNLQSGNRVKPGQEAGWENSHGYIVIMLNGVSFRAHRIAFLLMTGRWPDGELDHINGNASDNRWANIRPATRSQNNSNKLADKRNKSGFKGVSWHQNLQKWHARIQVNRRRINLGLFENVNDAADAYQSAAKIHHGDFARF